MLKLYNFINRYCNVLFLVYFITSLLLFKDDYFFGDAISSTSRLALNIYENGIIFYPDGFDPGHPPLYSILMAISWKIFGKTLLVSHIYAIACCLFLFLGFRKVGGLFLDRTYLNLASILVLIHPTFISQNAMMINTALLMGCFLWAIYFLFSKQNNWLIIILSIMMITHLQASFFLASMAIADLFIERRERSFLAFIKQRFFTYAIPFFVFIIWLIIHHQHTGWWIKSPDFTDTEETNTVKQFVKGLAYCVWRFSDYGMIIPIVIYIYLKIKSKKISSIDYFLWITLVITSVIMSFILKNTIAHRYFLAFEFLLIILVVKEISMADTPNRIQIYLVLVALIIGNFIYYPGKTIADANIQYRSYYTCFQELTKELKPNTLIYGKAPIANEMKFINLESNELNIKRIDSSIENLPSVVTSNICSEFNKSELEILNNWYGRSFENGAVHVELFLNPLYHAKPSGWELRKPGKFEQWMLKMKDKFK